MMSREIANLRKERDGLKAMKAELLAALKKVTFPELNGAGYVFTHAMGYFEGSPEMRLDAQDNKAALDVIRKAQQT